ncbi:DoxX family protein [bacterium]|nr:DoxX family protein [bacterium]
MNQSASVTPTASIPYTTFRQILLLVLRIAAGWHFLYEGVTKLLTPGWSSAAYLELSRWAFSGLFQWIASHPVVLKIVDLMNIWGLMAIGLGLMLGLFTRIAAIAGMLLLGLYYVANPPFVGLDFGVPAEGNYLIVDKNLVEFFALGVLAFFPGSFGMDRLIRRRNTRPAASPPSAAADEKSGSLTGRREIIKGLAGLPFLGAFGIALAQKIKWESWEEKNLVDAMTSASVKTFDPAGLKELKGLIPAGTIKGRTFSRLILGGNLLSGWAHSRDLMYVSQLVKAYHHKDKIFATLLMAEKCGINTLLTNPILCTVIDEYWKRNIGKIQFISDCAGLNYDAQGKPSPMPFQEYLDRVQRAIDYGAAACYIQGETADFYMKEGQADKIGRVLDLIRSRKVLLGIGAHNIETIEACVKAGFEPDFWMKTLHHLNYWSARHPEWNDNLYCRNPQRTIEVMKSLPQPFIAFKTMAAGAIHPRDGFRFAFENGADFVCAGMYDFQMVEDVNIAAEVLNSDLKRDRPWTA